MPKFVSILVWTIAIAWCVIITLLAALMSAFASDSGTPEAMQMSLLVLSGGLLVAAAPVGVLLVLHARRVARARS